MGSHRAQQQALADSPLRLLLTSREPRYDAPLPGKVVAIEVPVLSPEAGRC